MLRKYKKFKLSCINTACSKVLKYQHYNNEPFSLLLQKHINPEQD